MGGWFNGESLDIEDHHHEYLMPIPIPLEQTDWWRNPFAEPKNLYCSMLVAVYRRLDTVPVVFEFDRYR